MLSTNKTTNLQLNKWVSSNYVKMDDFNLDNEKLDEFAGKTITTDKLINNASVTEGGVALDARMGKTFGDQLNTIDETLEEHGTQLSDKVNKVDNTKQLGGGDLINGDFRVNQRAVNGTVILTAGQYGHDRWKASTSGCTYTFATSGGVTTITITSGSLIQVVEGTNLQTGTYVLSWGGTAQGKVGTGSYSASGVSSSVTGGTNLSIEFGVGTLSNAKLEKNTVITPFIPRLYGEELILCKKYYQIYVMRGIATTTSIIMCLNPNLPVDMRIAPNVDTSNNPSGLSTIGVGYTATPGGVVMSVFPTFIDACTSSAGNLTVGRAYSLNLKLDAEL